MKIARRGLSRMSHRPRCFIRDLSSMGSWLIRFLANGGPSGFRMSGQWKRKEESVRSGDARLDPRKLEELTPPILSIDQRIELATRCHDMDDVRRCAGAGGVKVLSDQTRVQIMHNGLRVLADGYCGEWMTRLIERCRGCHEPQEERVFHEVMARLPAKATMIELGGYWAFYSLWFLSLGKPRRAIVVEPDPKHLDSGADECSSEPSYPRVYSRIYGSYVVPASAIQDGGIRRNPGSAFQCAAPDGTAKD